MHPNACYASYLLRLRLLQDDNCTVWVASIVCTATGEYRSFSGVDALVAFLQTEYGNNQDRPSDLGSTLA